METKTAPMEYRFLGPTGLKVSAISYGCMDIRDQEKLNALIKKAWDLGINFFDCAETYGSPRGQVEGLLGNALKALNVPREDLVIATKIFWGGDGQNAKGLSRKHVVEGVNNCLKRLQLSYVDLIFAHRYDVYTPMEEICRAFDWVIRQGKALYWGTSEWPAIRIKEAIDICEKLNLHKPVVEQPQYSVLCRERFEKEYAPLFRDYKMGTTIWSPIAGGVLSGKYNFDIPSDSRLKNSPMAFILDKWLKEDKIEATRKTTIAFCEIAKEIGCTPAQLALAWALKNSDVTTAIVGSTKFEQLEENVRSIDFVSKITPEIEEKINKIAPKPEADLDFRSWKGLPGRREQATL